MESTTASDTVLVRTCAEFEALLAGYTVDCRTLEEAEFHPSPEPNLAEARSRLQRTIERWRSTLRRIGQLPAHTKPGALAKARALRPCFEHGLATDEDVLVLIRSLMLDLDKLLSDPCEVPLPVPPVDARRAIFRLGSGRGPKQAEELR